MLIPDSDGKMKQFKVSFGVLYSLAALAFMIVASHFFLSAEFFTTKVNQVELEKLRAENTELKDKYEQLRWNVSEIEDRYHDLVYKEDQIRNLFDLPEINSEQVVVRFFRKLLLRRTKDSNFPPRTTTKLEEESSTCI